MEKLARQKITYQQRLAKLKIVKGISPSSEQPSPPPPPSSSWPLSPPRSSRSRSSLDDGVDPHDNDEAEGHAGKVNDDDDQASTSTASGG